MFRSFQGEGPYTGEDAVFIRLGGCNLDCGFCDTDHGVHKKMIISDILKAVNAIAERGAKINFVVLTGGEPLLQPIEYLCKELLDDGYRIQVETNGTLFRKLDPAVKIVCSPKAGARIDKRMLARADAFKFIISETYPGYQTIPELGQSDHKATIYVQPMDQGCEKKNKANLTRTLDICLKGEYKLSLQMHKLVGAK